MAATAAPALIQLVADDPHWREQLYMALQQEGYRVQPQPAPQLLKDLIRRGRGERPSLLVVNLPTERHDLVATLALIQRFRRRDPQMPLLLLADQAVEQERAQLLDTGADDVLVRPFGLREFVARCRAMLRRMKRIEQNARLSGAGRVITAGGLQLFREQCRVCLDGEEVNLTPREFRLLECFMLQPDRALSRDQLIEQVWGPDYCGNNKSVDVHVLWLRRKLDRPGYPSLFVTVRGIGYRFAPPPSPSRSP
jgi:two-component system phosphate regulon response regulator PhoB